jgi:predicted Zn-dependent protease
MKTHWFRYSCLFFVAIAGIMFLEGCKTVPVTGRRELNLVSAGQEMQLGLTSFDQLKTNTPISHDPTINAMVQRVGKRIAQVASKDLPDAQWEFVVFDSPEANAFCLPGGKVGVYTGILPITKDDAGLATVIGHEVGHAVAHHGSERMSEAMVMQGGGQLLGSAMSDSKWQSAAAVAYGLGTKGLRELPHSRKQESEADHIGVVYMARAGYDPKEAVAFWQRFMDYNRQHGGQSGMFAKFLSTHPTDETRIADLKKLLPEAEAEFSKSHIVTPTGTKPPGQ